MEIVDITDNKTDKDGDIRRRILISYPQLTGDGKTEKRINGFIINIVKEYKKNAAKASLYTYHKLKYRVCSRDPLSLFFESERRGDGRFSYDPFSVTFSADGYAVPLLLDKAKIRKTKRYFSDNGIRLSRRNIKYSYYLNNGKDTVIYAKKPDNHRAKRSVIEYQF